MPDDVNVPVLGLPHASAAREYLDSILSATTGHFAEHVPGDETDMFGEVFGATLTMCPMALRFALSAAVVRLAGRDFSA